MSMKSVSQNLCTDMPYVKILHEWQRHLKCGKKDN